MTKRFGWDRARRRDAGYHIRLGWDKYRRNPGTEPETLVQSARILADGGTIIDQFYMNQVIRTMKAQGIYTSAKFIGDANMAVKKDGFNAVSVLYDVSGNNNDAVQLTGANQPIWTVNAQNGKAGVVYNGTSSYLDNSTMVGATTGLTILTLLHPTSEPAFAGFWWERDGKRLLLTAAGILYAQMGVGGNYVSALTLANNTSGLIGFTYNGSQISFWKNGVQDSAPVTTSGSMINDNVFRIGASVANAYWFAGYIVNTFYFNVALTTAQRQSLESTINGYYAIY